MKLQLLLASCLIVTAMPMAVEAETCDLVLGSTCVTASAGAAQALCPIVVREVAVAGQSVGFHCWDTSGSGSGHSPLPATVTANCSCVEQPEPCTILAAGSCSTTIGTGYYKGPDMEGCQVTNATIAGLAAGASESKAANCIAP